MIKTIFESYEVKVTYAQAKRIVSLINGYLDLRQGDIGDYLELSKVRAQLQEIIDTEETVL